MSVTNNDDRRVSLGDGDHDPHFDPIITLPEVKVPTLEEEETVLYRVRAKLFRRDRNEKEWKERGTGEARLLFHEKNKTVRVLMRRDKTLKVCANHYVTPDMILKPNCGSDRAWVWNTLADATDDIPKAEILAMRFMNADAAKSWKEKFEEAKAIVVESFSPSALALGGTSTDDEVSTSPSNTDDEEEKTDFVEKVQSLSIKEETDKEDVKKEIEVLKDNKEAEEKKVDQDK